MHPNRNLILWALLLSWLGFAVPAQAVTYANSATAFSWINPATHTHVTWTSGASCSAAYANAPVDDDITAQLPLGFTFNYGGVNYTQVQIMSNGRLQFNNGYCSYGTQTVGPPPTYPYSYPDANLLRTMRIYGVDLDATSSGAAGICPTASCYVSYSMVGTAPNRQFVVTWVNVPEWGSVSRTGSFNLQVILYETTNEFVYQFGTSSHPTGGAAQIGWELTTTDYLVWATPVVPAANTAVRFYIPSPLTEFRMDESAWSAAGTVINSVASGTNGSPVGAAQTVAGGKFCRGGNFPANASTGTIDVVDTGLDVDTQIGSSGTISFWYKSNVAWSGATSQSGQLLDATTVNNRWFYVVKQQGNGRLSFNLTDSANNNFVVTTGNNSIAANTWTHITVTWNLTPLAANNRLRIYINGALAKSTVIGTTNPLSASIGTLYIGDNRSGFTTAPGTGNSANGIIDEVRIYNYEATPAVVLRDYNATYACPAMDHIRIEHDGAGLTCAAETLTLKACADASCATLYNSGNTTVTLSGSGWSSNPVTFTGSTTVNLSITSPQTVTLATTAVSPAPPSPLECFNGTLTNGTTACQLPFADTGFIFSATTPAFSVIPTQVAGTTSVSYVLQAVQKSNSAPVCVGLFTGSVAIDMASQCVNPTTCAGKQVTINATAITNNPASGISGYTPVTLNFGANSIANFTLNYPDVGMMNLSARKLLAGTDYMTGSSNAFVVKPDHFALSGIQQTAAPNTANPGAASAAGAKFVKAGEAFSATVTAATSGGAATPNFGKETSAEGVLLVPNLIAPSGGTNPAITNGTIAGSSFSNGVATVSNLAWSEVGIITITPKIADSDYLGAGNVSATVTGNVGRFVPDHFALTSTSLTNRTDMGAGTGCSPASAFTYMGEPFGIGFTLTAQNAANITTQNYASANSFAKLDGATVSKWTQYAVNDSMGLGAIDNAVVVKTPLSARLSVVSPAGPWTGGTAPFIAQVAVNRAAAPDGSYENFDIGIAPQDADGIALLAGAYNLDANNDTVSERAKLASSKIRFGRLRMNNAYGSELLPLPVPLMTQYWNGSGFVLNTDDSCTQVTVPTSANGGLTFYATGSANQLVAGDTLASVNGVTAGSGTFASGDGGLRLTKPPSGHFGYVDILINAPDWLLYNWGITANDVAPYNQQANCPNPNAITPSNNDCPKSRATFGKYKQRNEFIYMREVH
jgi:MSHA biogenesis protein MshQ